MADDILDLGNTGNVSVSAGNATDYSSLDPTPVATPADVTKKTTKPLSFNDMTRIVESPGYIKEYLKDRKAFFPSVDFSNPKSFAKFGLAEEYYKNAVENIYKTYPYDGSLKEKYEWHNNVSYIDNYIFDAEYPRTNGYVNVGFPWKNSSKTTKTIGAVDQYTLSDTPQYISFKGGPHAPSVPAYSGGEYTKPLSVKEEEQRANIYNSTSSQIQNMTVNGQVGNTVEFWFKYPTNPLSDQESPNFAYFDLWNEQTIGSIVPGSEYGRFLIETKLAYSSYQYQENCMFNITYRSGSSGVDSAKIGLLDGPTPAHVTSKFGIDLTEWNHFAFSIKNNPTGSDHLLANLYINGILVESVHTGSQIGEVKEGPFNANLGAYRTGPNTSAVAGGVVNGYGTISGSFDEFRFWTNQRTSEEIKIFHIDHVGGGTNTDYGDYMSKYSGSVNPVDLGVYFKFNEGIVGNSNSDKTVLDYSGRVTNGLFNNYSSNCRSTGSAFVESNAVTREFKDPIIYSFHPSVVSYKDSATQKGKEYDDRNTMGIYYSLPGWILDEDSEKSNYTIKNLTQIIASYFDDLYLQTRQLPDFKHNTYPSGSISGSFVEKPLPFADKLLSNMGFVAPEIFTDVDEISEFLNRDEDRLFEEKLFEIRNQIYYNIYNNLNFINKSKGTEKAIRNLIRCFGVDDDIYSINFYANNAKLDLRRAAQLKGAKKTYADFSRKANFEATVFQNTASSNSNSVSFITGSNIVGGGADLIAVSNAWDFELPFTMEAEVIFPSKPGEQDPQFDERHYTQLTASLFGMHTAIISPSNLTPSSDDDELTWAADDEANFQVYAVRDKVKSPNSSIVKFVLTGSNVNSTTEARIPELTSSFFDNVYDNEKWNFSVKFKPVKYPSIGKVSGSEKSDYILEWRGYNLIGDTVQNEFYLTASIPEADGLQIAKSKKRVYIGSHRTNFTGSLLHATDVKISSCRFWINDLSEEELFFHALDPKNYGVFHANSNAFLLQDANGYPVEIPKIKTLVLNWDFETLTGSDIGDYSGEFSVLDFSSGSSDSRYKTQFSNLFEKQHTGRGAYFHSANNYTGSLSRETVYGLRQQVPENLNSSEAVKILSRDDELFTPSTRPINFLFTIEKSMYQSVSEEMMNFLAAAIDSTDLENLIGEPVNRYRMDYKGLEKIRNIFFERVGNTPDVDKYLNYFKWLDSSISTMILNTIPASSEFSKVSNVIESHIFERNKYWNKFPTLEEKPPGQQVNSAIFQFSTNETVRTTNRDASGRPVRGLVADAMKSTERRTSWSQAHQPIDDDSENLRIKIPYWQTKADRTTSVLTSGDTTIDQQRNNIREVLGDTTRVGLTAESGKSLQTLKSSTGNSFGLRSLPADLSFGMVVNRSRPKHGVNKRPFVFSVLNPGDSTNIQFNTADIQLAEDYDWDGIEPSRKYKPEFKINLSTEPDVGFSGRTYFPYAFYSGSMPTSIVPGYQITSQHLRDYYVDTKDVPLQSPFTEQNVGGYAYRHGGIMVEPPTQAGALGLRPEGWYAFRSPAGAYINFTIYNPYNLPGSNYNYPRADFLRDESAKRPVNIRNIKSTRESYLPQRTELPPVNELGSTKPYVGNYEKDYQIITVGGRDINNRYLVRSGSISTASIPSTGIPSVSGAYDWEVPNRGRSEHIFVSKFSSPGGPETAGAAFNDYTSDTFSVYNALPFRNLSVRGPLNTFYRYHSLFGGYDSNSGSPHASFHKFSRNPARRIETSDIFSTYVTGTVYDNAFVQHMIPRSDMNYLWISSSFSGSEIFGYQKRDFNEKSFASTEIVFASGSITGSQGLRGRLINTDFVGLNSVMVGALEITGANSNTLTFSSNVDLANSGQGISSFLDGALVLNAINSKRGGPSLVSSWKNGFSHYHPLAREMREKNIISLIKETPLITPGSSKNYILSKEYVYFTEPPISFKYKPLEHEFIMNDGNKAYLESTYANTLAGFSNEKINRLLNYNPEDNENTTYENVKKVYIDKEIPEEYQPFESLDKLLYKEVVYPRGQNVGLAKVRGRENYTVSSGSTEFNVRLGNSRAFWKDNINDRLRSDAVARNAQGLIVASGSSYFGLTDMSIWPLDSEEAFFDLYLISSSAGENGKYDPFYWAPLEPSSALKGLDPANVPRLANVNKNGELSYAGYIYGLFGINIQGKIRADDAPTASAPFPNFKGDGTVSGRGLNFKPTASFQYEFPNMMMSGSMRRVTPIEGSSGFVTGFRPTASLHLMAPYRTNVLSGKSPWFNSYEDYSEDIRRMAKDYTVLPEFRISDHMEYYLKEGFFSDNNKFLSLVGSSLNISSSATNETGSFQADFFRIYSHSDFMKHFSVIQEDHKKENAAFVSKIRLEANAVKKLLPYQGFYPTLRSVQLGHLFSSSYAPFISGSNVRDGDQERLAALYQPFFAPGVFFNTIKSGIAVQYPVHTGSMPDIAQATDELRLQMPTTGAVYISSYYDTAPNYAFPFEAILDPDQYLPLSSSLTSSGLTQLSSSVYMVYPNFTGSWMATKTDGFYAAQSVDAPYTSTKNQPQMFFEWKGQSDPKYSLAASNFFAESVDFFLEKGTLTSFISKTEKDFKSMLSGSTYYMDVLLYKTDDFVSYEGPPSGTFNYDAGKEHFDAQTADDKNLAIARSGDGLLNLGVSARGMHYGPAYTTHGLTFGSTGTGSVPFASYRAQDPAYAPHTPPYFYGTSRARLAFKPHKVRDMATGEAAKFTLEEILSNARIETEYENENERSRTLQENSYRNHYAAGIAQMQLSSSVNLFGQMTLKEVQYDTERNPDGSFKARGATTPVVQGTNDAWIIETKFECPSVNLAHMDTASLGAGIGDGKEKYHTRGIWKGYGVIPSGSEGLFLQLKESYPQVTNDIGGSSSRELTGSLIDVCGFRASKERVGKIRSKKEICEAIIAVPIDEKGNFYHIDRDMYNKQKLNYEKNNKALLAGDFGVEKDIGETSITQMIEKMKKFSLPPQMDFLNNPNVDPFVMYIFEFKHLLGKQDLADIWQNLMPDISRIAEKDTSAVEHEIGVNYEFFGQYKRGELPENIRWMVFKAKQKARNNFFNVTQQSEVAKGFTFTALNELQGVASNPEAELTYSYNWPYDFFSLVELAQVESEITFESFKERVEVEEIDKKTNERTKKVVLREKP